MTDSGRAGTSRWKAKREFSLLNCERGIVQCFGDITEFQVGVFVEDLVVRHPVGNHRDDCGNGEPKVTDAWSASHLVWRRRDAFEFRVSDYRLANVDPVVGLVDHVEVSGQLG